MKKPRAVIYDSDGMLTHGERFSDRYMQEFGIDPAVMAPFFSGSLKKCQVGEADFKEELANVLEAWHWKGTAGELMDYWFSIGDALYEDTYASVGKLKEQGAVVCLATNNEKYRTKYLVKKFSYDSLFDELFSSAQLGAFKHSPEGLLMIAQALSAKRGITDRKEIMYWDDRTEHIAIFNAQGFNGQLYQDYPSFKEVMAEHGHVL